MALVYQSQNTNQILLFLQRPLFNGSGSVRTASLPLWSGKQVKRQKVKRLVLVSREVQANSTSVTATDTDTTTEKTTVKLKAVVQVTVTVAGFFSSLRLDRGIDDITDLLGKSLLLELVSSELDPEAGLEKETIKAYAHKAGRDNNSVKYETDFEVPNDFGEIGAILVENEHHKEMFLETILLDGFPEGPIHFHCASWVHSKFDNPTKRVFFTNKCYIPSETPSGIRRIRAEELSNLRGSGEGERKSFERIYDYDIYNDMGDPDKSLDLQRPPLGGKELPYPRRCRTGRPHSEADPLSEKRSRRFYVPRDECFSEVKELTFSTKTLYAVLLILVPSLGKIIKDKELAFPYFHEIDSLFSIGLDLPHHEHHETEKGFLGTIMPRLVKNISGDVGHVLRFETPEAMSRDRFFWFRDEEFARQTVAGLNPCSIKLVKEWPLRSKLDPIVYGPAESAITSEIINKEIGGILSVEKAIKEKKLFMLDYHDLFLPYVSRVRELKGKTLYGSRTLFFLTPDGTLRPLAIELTRPPMDGKGQWKQVFTPSWHSTSVWLWRIAKAHVLAHDSGYHQLVSHWLRTHCVTEPYVIATNRQLSEMHPIYRLLHPHFRYTIEINALAREALINADGTIESSFTPGKYSMEICSAAYDLEWRFDMQALPADLIRRGMAVQDPFAPHGLRLTIPDYPYANDGLLLWDTIKVWVTDYVNHYYPESSLVELDVELQAWWTEIRTVGHADKKDEPWWPVLKTPKDLIEILNIIIWVTSGHHAAVNFGQYAYGGYFPNRPTIARTKMPIEDPTEEEWKKFIAKPESALLKCFPSQLQATRVMAVLDILSTHSPDEEYIGEKMEPSWAENPVINAAFERFRARLKKIETLIDERNENTNLKNRNGAGVIPYELLKPFSKPGVTGMGVPCSISI
ncbi:linoleate 13S-lipoxygenase 2-1, chloroplastic-like isoform X1 [Gastrolobium bilobum]|uniref:linoleate 13S-lipoxygenase 2-1, chloroplastic-like isoform X1 n=1 Tax=Gastrolobium bilobum TaxID=150636 RepID=UPI002AB10764|nr:linoleate 13S-lipoxygenase 2-1, chloroplastic-like isoform X1 [Gastrolobium bilobum]